MSGSAYIVDATYASAFTPTQSPLALCVGLELAGVAARDPRHGFNYIELCCGEGLTLCLLAACYPQSRFIGVDINPHHIAIAQARAQACELANVEFIVSDVLEFEPPAGEVHFLSVLGAFTWLNAPRQHAVLQMAGRCLAHDGALLLHYASMPGALQTQALHQALAWLSPRQGGSIDRLDAALAALAPHASGRFFKLNPVALRSFEAARQARRADVAHEVMSAGARPLWFGEIMEMALEASLWPIVEADSFEPIATGAPPVDEIVRRQTLREIDLNRPSRQDVWVRDQRKTSRAAHLTLPWYIPPRYRNDVARISGALGAPLDQARELLAFVERGNFAVTGEGDGARASIVRRALARGVLQPRLWPSDSRPDNALMSGFNRHALEHSLRHASALPLAAHALGSQLVLPAAERLQLFAWSGGDVGALLSTLKPIQGAQCQKFVEGAAMARFERETLPELRTLGVVGVPTEPFLS